MQTEVFSNIDLLIEMAGVTGSSESINAELVTIRKSIINKQNEIEDLKSIMVDNRYFNASNELVDKNIEISLKSKINRLNRKLKEVKNNIKEINISESKLYEDIKKLKATLKQNEEYIKVLEEKTAKSINSYYSNILRSEKEHYKSESFILEEKNKEHNNILKELELNNQASIEIKASLEVEEKRLADVMDSLQNPNAYLDEDLRKEDEEKLSILEEELKDLEAKELELLQDARIIGMSAKELLSKNLIDEALNKIKELVDIVKSKPYMDIADLAVVSEELTKEEARREELKSLIDTKSYEGVNSTAINERLDFISKEIEKNDDMIAKYNDNITSIDDFISNIIASKISNLEQEILENNEVLKKYYSMLKEEGLSLKAKSNLEQAIAKKEKENDILQDIAKLYKDELISKVNETNKLTSDIESLKEKNRLYENEKEELKRLGLMNFQTRDLVEEANDKEELKAINERIKQIKNRMQYENSPSEIYDQIEMLLASIKPVTLKEEKIKPIEIDTIITNEEKPVKENIFKVIDMIPVSTVKKTEEGNI